ncbi:uncharacterized protein LOC106650484 [Trichogramma pretiosum]|uniref:uncharacterized protein LOC106650484 n=1 Tax=Trichogramma pretiosum TaxID=7493 RepID=UPI0006C96F1F|nr:uncharacterized protein LOC106650484 [Trichogramma pretiosum]
MASNGWKVVQAHVPLIRFRKGGNARVVGAAAKVASSAGGSQHSAPSATTSKPAGATGPNVLVLPVIEDFQLPPRFQRRQIDIKEMDYINRGGPE